MLLRELNRCKSAVGGSLENKYRCYLLAELTITKQSFASPPPPPSVMSLLWTGLNRLGLGMVLFCCCCFLCGEGEGVFLFLFFLKQRRLHVFGFIYSRNPDPLKREKRGARVAGYR